MIRQFLSTLASAITSAMRAVGGAMAAPARSIWTMCQRTGRWVEEKIPGGQILTSAASYAASGAAFGAGLVGVTALGLIASVGLPFLGSVAALAPVAAGTAAAFGAIGAATGAHHTMVRNGGYERLGNMAMDVAPSAAGGIASAGRGLGRGISRAADAGLSAVGAVASIPGRILGGLLGGGGAPAAPGADAYEQQAASATPGRNATPAKRTAQIDRQVAAAVRDAAATRADAIDELRPEAGHERDRGLPAAVVGWLDRLSPDELRVIARLPSEDIGTLVNGGQVLGVRPLSTREMGTDCISVWTAAALAQEVTAHEALRAAMVRAPAVPVGAGPDADMEALHELDQRFREQLRPARPSSISARIQAASARREERERTPAPVGGLIVH